MSEKKPSPENPQDAAGNPTFGGTKAAKTPDPAALALPEVEKHLEEILEGLPAPQREEVKQTIFQIVMAFIQKGGGTAPSIDAETAKILADSANQEHEYRFKYLTQKQHDAEEKSKRDDDFRVKQHDDRYKIVRPCSYGALLVTVVLVFLGVYFSVSGHEILGSSLITGAITGFLSFIAGLGVSSLFKDKS